jgi:predicted acylesterase/phospholipase RssA
VQIPFAPLHLNETYHVLMIMIAALTDHRLNQSPPDLLLRPVLPTNVSLLSGFHHSAEIIAAGEAAAEAALPAIRELVGLQTQPERPAQIYTAFEDKGVELHATISA